MKYQPRFKGNNPSNKEEKIIVQICKDLHELMRANIRLNQDLTDHQIFLVLRDSAVAFAGQSIEALIKLMTENDQKFLFLKECQDIFNCYIQQASETIK